MRADGVKVVVSAAAAGKTLSVLDLRQRTLGPVLRGCCFCCSFVSCFAGILFGKLDLSPDRVCLCDAQYHSLHNDAEINTCIPFGRYLLSAADDGQCLLSWMQRD